MSFKILFGSNFWCTYLPYYGHHYYLVVFRGPVSGPERVKCLSEICFFALDNLMLLAACWKSTPLFQRSLAIVQSIAELRLNKLPDLC